MPYPCTDKAIYPHRDSLIVRDWVETGEAELLARLDPKFLRVANIASQEPCIVGAVSTRVLSGLDFCRELFDFLVVLC